MASNFRARATRCTSLRRPVSEALRIKSSATTGRPVKSHRSPRISVAQCGPECHRTESGWGMPLSKMASLSCACASSRRGGSEGFSGESSRTFSFIRAASSTSCTAAGQQIDVADLFRQQLAREVGDRDSKADPDPPAIAPRLPVAQATPAAQLCLRRWAPIRCEASS